MLLAVSASALSQCKIHLWCAWRAGAGQPTAESDAATGSTPSKNWSRKGDSVMLGGRDLHHGPGGCRGSLAVKACWVAWWQSQTHCIAQAHTQDSHTDWLLQEETTSAQRTLPADGMGSV